MRAHRPAIWLAVAFAACCACASARAAEIVVPEGADLQAAIDGAAEGDTVVVRGKHAGPITIARRLTLQGEQGAAIAGTGEGSVIRVTAPGAVVRGFAISGSGRDLEAMDAGVFVEQSAAGAVVEGNRIEGNLYGIYLHGAPDSLARGNTIVGINEGPTNEAGNGVSVWNAPGAKVLDNDISFGRDGIFVTASQRNEFAGNRFRDLRFAVHYMYTNDSKVSGNVSLGNVVGYALMYSQQLIVQGNVSDGDRDHGLLLNFVNRSEIAGNKVKGRLQPAERWTSGGQRSADGHVPSLEPGEAALLAGARTAPEKCVFIYNANQNVFRDNRFEGCEIGVHFTAGSESNTIQNNAFVDNRNQVKYVGTRHLDWSKEGRGNYWSDNPAFDLDGDGIADTAYRPNDVIDKVLWTAPQAKVLLNSPAVQVIRWAQAQFPALLPGGVVDSHPLMAPPAPPTADNPS